MTLLLSVDMALIIVVIGVSAVIKITSAKDIGHADSCFDWRGVVILEGDRFVPEKEQPCTNCVCEGGFPVMCRAVLCSPPKCTYHEKVMTECCKFHCLSPPDSPDFNPNMTNGILPDTPISDLDKGDLGLRLVASTVTSFLILALLLFMIHRLRQRRMLIMMRRLNAERRGDEDTVAYMSHFDVVDVGIDFPPYEERPPPYSAIPKHHQGEAPPTYDESQRQQMVGPLNNNEGEQASQEMQQEPRGAVLEMQTLQTRDNSSQAVCEAAPPTETRVLDRNGNAVGESETEAESRDGEGDTLRKRRLCSESDSQIDEPGLCLQPWTAQERYGLSVAIATVSSTDPAQSPSHVIVQMHGALVNPEASGSVRDPNILTSPRMRFIKKSESMEIKQGSQSPRNSFHIDQNLDSVGCESPIIEPIQFGRYMITENIPNQRTPAERPTSLVQNPEVGSLVTLLPDTVIQYNKGTKPFRIQLDSPVYLNCDRRPYSCLVPEREDVRDAKRCSLPPETMDSSFWFDSTASSASTASPQEQFARGAMTPNSLSPAGAAYGTTPQSPFPPMARSQSIASQLSVFSVCSETGEKRTPKPKPPTRPMLTLRNGFLHGLSCSPSNDRTVTPTPMDISFTEHGSQGVPAGMISSTSSADSYMSSPGGGGELGAKKDWPKLVEPVAPLCMVSSMSSITSQGTMTPCDGHPLDNTDWNGNSNSRTDAKNDNLGDDSSPDVAPVHKGQYADNEDSKAHRGGTHTGKAGCAEESSKLTNSSEKNTVRKVKQKKRNSRHHGTTDADLSNGVSTHEKADHNSSSNHGRGKYKALSSPTASTDTTYKQYGFIDNPESNQQNGCEATPQNGPILSSPTSGRGGRSSRKKKKVPTATLR